MGKLLSLISLLQAVSAGVIPRGTSWTSRSADEAAGLTYKGVDWSSVPIEEAAGRTYSTESGQVQPIESILVASGVNTVRQRIWVTDGDYGLDYNLALAKRARDAGLKVYLDFHYSSIWADPAHQDTPTEWASYDLGDLKYAVYNYTMDTLNAFAAADLPLEIVSIGNEIRNGLLFPLGSISTPANVAAILHSASAGVKDSNLAQTPQIMIHLDNGWSYSTQEYWYDAVLGAGDLTTDDFDIQGVSYYPFYNGNATLASLDSSLNSMKSKYGKAIQVVETDWPLSCPDPEYPFPADTTSIPFSAAGQSTFIKDIANVVSGAGGNGFFYWEPMWIDNAALGSSCPNNVMVSDSGQALSSLSVFGEI